MAAHYPYVLYYGNVIKIINHLQVNFPAKISNSTIKEAGVPLTQARQIIKALKFIDIIDEKANRKDEWARIFVPNNDNFAQELEKLVKKAYLPLFQKYKQEEYAWTAIEHELTIFFKATDRQADATAGMQARTFIAFAELAGKRTPSKKNQKETTAPSQPKPPAQALNSKISLAGKFEIHLPAGGTKEDYDNIFKSIKENIIND